VTLHNIQNLYSYNASPPTRLFTNSLVVSVTNYATYSGVNNQTLTTDTGVFQSVGAGYHYLASGSAYRNIGTTNNVGASLLADLKKRTTYPPVILTSDFTTDTTLSPQAQRDIDTPDLGYHYDALDWCWGGRNLTNCTLTLTNGVAVGLYNTAATILRSNGKFVSEGLPACLNRIVRYQAVQEQSVVLGTVGSPMVFWDLATTTGQVRLRFSDVSLMADAYSRRSLVGNQGSQAINPLSISHSQLRGVYLAFSDSQSSSSTIIAMTNNIVERSTLSWSKTDSYYPFTLYQYNNLFRTGTNSYSTATAAASWTIKDNLFDCDSLTKTGAGSFTVSNNGYKSGLTSLGGTGNITGLVPDYQTGSLGGFYYPTSGGSTSLVNLSNAGSRTAGSATLYHFATTTNQAKEASTTVDIGYHYVAVDGAGNPIDTDGDGYSDCLEDWNGNGTFDTGESDWQTSNSGISGTAGLQVFTPLK
jgi:hypothetical protein